jgi:hypothetical protein
MATKDPIISPVYICKNMHCCGGKEETNAKRLSNHTFTIYSEVCFDQYPPEVKEAYADILFRDVANGNNGQFFVSEELCCKVLDDRTLFSQMANDLANEHGQNR